MALKNFKIEHGLRKQNVREEIIRQATYFVANEKQTTVNSLTLPGANAYFEIMLDNQMKKMGVTLSGKGCERDTDLFCQVSKIIPKNFSMTSFDINDQPFSDFNFIWLDYCGFPDATKFQAWGNALSAIKQGIVYVTFSLTSRQKTKQQLADWITSGQTDPATALRLYTENYLVKHYSNRHLIMDIIYPGGTSGKIAMMTIGIQVGEQQTIPLDKQDWLSSFREYNKTKKYKKKITNTSPIELIEIFYNKKIAKKPSSKAQFKSHTTMAINNFKANKGKLPKELKQFLIKKGIDIPA